MRKRTLSLSTSPRTESRTRFSQSTALRVESSIWFSSRWCVQLLAASCKSKTASMSASRAPSTALSSLVMHRRSCSTRTGLDCSQRRQTVLFKASPEPSNGSSNRFKATTRLRPSLQAFSSEMKQIMMHSPEVTQTTQTY